ncbi:glycosyltransferase family 4 protein [Pseudomonas monteilii]|uniref:glycosyltransferase family 4 protein n=1 Tax=Pseudomonas monteilii TaxID=76759 RepID=UPI0018AA1801|nr:glycosyltransferase family 4 protein [Pseudomonas monteilii]MBF8748658.1 glycosyltransferase family 4 protein [Pseudomonas monteilii]
MRVAIVHDWLVTFAGAEKVLAELFEIWPDAELFSVIDFLSDEDRLKIKGKVATTTFIQKLPKAKDKYKIYLPLMPIAIEQLDLRGFDLVLSSSHAVAKGVIVGPDQLHICYCHSPIRYAWDMQSQYLSESGLATGLKGLIARRLLFNVRNWDSRSASGVDYFISNSNYIGRRIDKVYRRCSTTIYPNVAVEEFSVVEDKDDFYLTASRMVPYKKMDLIVRAFAGMPDKRLVVIGDGPQFSKVLRDATPNVQVLGYQPFEVLKDHMQRAKAFVFAAEEDFGIIPVEAQACGTPVVAYARGGALETVIDGHTGVFFKEQNEESIQEAIKRFEETFVAHPVQIRAHAEGFSTTVFRARLTEFVEEKLKDFFSFTKNEQ